MSSLPFTIAVLSGKGGVGKTTISLNLARELSRYAHVWLVDIDLFNRGATSALWESEKEIPLSVASLVLDSTGDTKNKFLRSSDPDKRRRAYVTELKKRLDVLAYDDQLVFLPAARAKEGRTASYLLWKGFSENAGAASGTAFLHSLLEAIELTSPGCIVVLDGHGGLDDLSLAAADVSDICYIVNEPDLITFTGSLTLFREIRDMESSGGPAAHAIQFIINRVPPNRSIYDMQRDFGDVLASMSSQPEPVAAYFPLERELFGVFGDDPFVYEIYTQYWFSRKVRMIAEETIDRGLRSKRLDPARMRDGAPSVNVRDDASAKKRRTRTRYALRREFHKRSDLLLTSWLGFSTFAAIVFFFFQAFGDTSPRTALFLAGVAIVSGITLAVQTGRWARVQLTHARNASKIREHPRRRLRFGTSKAAKVRDAEELVAGKRVVRRNLVRAAIVAGVIAVIAAIAIPNLMTAASRSKQKRTMADLRSLATAVEAMATDINAYPGVTFEQLPQVVSPTYIKTVPPTDAWGTPFRYWALTCRESNPPLTGSEFKIPLSRLCNEYAFASAGSDKIFEHDDVMDYEKDQTKTFADDLVFANGDFIRSPDTVVATVDRERRQQAAKDMRTAAAAIKALGAGLNGYPQLSYGELHALLSSIRGKGNPPLASADPWGSTYVYWTRDCRSAQKSPRFSRPLNNVEFICASYALASPGADKAFKGFGNFDPSLYQEGVTSFFEDDLVIVDGKFIRAPAESPKP